jgi:hypothetical protein
MTESFSKQILGREPLWDRIPAKRDEYGKDFGPESKFAEAISAYGKVYAPDPLLVHSHVRSAVIPKSDGDLNSPKRGVNGDRPNVTASDRPGAIFWRSTSMGTKNGRRAKEVRA